MGILIFVCTVLQPEEALWSLHFISSGRRVPTLGSQHWEGLGEMADIVFVDAHGFKWPIVDHQ